MGLKRSEKVTTLYISKRHHSYCGPYTCCPLLYVCVCVCVCVYVSCSVCDPWTVVGPNLN